MSAIRHYRVAIIDGKAVVDETEELALAPSSRGGVVLLPSGGRVLPLAGGWYPAPTREAAVLWVAEALENRLASESRDVEALREKVTTIRARLDAVRALAEKKG